MKLSPIIEAEELLDIYTNRELKIFDVSNGLNAKAKYDEEHLKGAIWVDLNYHLSEVPSDFSMGGRHPLPNIRSFAKTLGDLGISEYNHIVLYDDKNSSNAAARFWWMLKSIGHKKVQVLNGGKAEAKLKQLPMSSKIESYSSAAEPYPYTLWRLPTIHIDEVEKASQNSKYTIIDVRDKARFKGLVEPIDLIAGHIPNAINIPFTENLDPNGKFISPVEMRKKYQTIFDRTSVENIIVHCGSGVTACHTLLALDLAGFEVPNLYVGSWSEWSRNNKSIVTANQE